MTNPDVRSVAVGTRQQGTRGGRRKRSHYDAGGRCSVSRTVAAVLTVCALSAGAAGFPAAASASHDQITFFEAPRDLLDPAHRNGAFAQLDSLGVHALRVVLYWQSVAPASSSRKRPNFDPGRGQGARLARPPDHLGPGAPVGDSEQARPRHPTRPPAVPAVRHRGGAPLRFGGRNIRGLERAQPSLLPGSAVRGPPSAGLAPHLPRSGPGGHQRPTRGRAERSQGPDR